MKIALCQINTTVADFDGNVARVVAGIRWAKKQNASAAVFPELTTFGYPPRDLLDKPYLIEANIRAAEAIARHTSHDFGCVFGMVSRNSAFHGKGLFNTACFAHAGQLQFEQPKTLLPTYDVFDEARHFDPAPSIQPHLFQGKSFGLMVCEDIWSEYDFDGKRYYDTHPGSLLTASGAEVLINISASPFHSGVQKIRREVLAQEARLNGLPILYCNLVGGNDELVFDGQSLVVDGNGCVAWEGKAFREDYGVVDLEKLRPVRVNDFSEMAEMEEALVLGLKDYLRKCGFKKVLVGLSGGIDSSVVAALAAKALGSKNVLGVLMPSGYSSRGSLRDAGNLAKNLRIPTRILPIGEVYQNYLAALNIDVSRKIPLAAENIQARIRGNLLMAISNQTGALVLSTGNKSELACGYCTLYGDLAGGLALLSDVPKTKVYALARFLNRRKKIIPESVFKKPPSAELKPNQKDQDSLPPYDKLDGILKAYIEDHHDFKTIVRQGYPRKMVQDVIRRVDHNEYKRRQSPPGIKITSKAFGIGRRFPIAWKHS